MGLKKGELWKLDIHKISPMDISINPVNCGDCMTNIFPPKHHLFDCLGRDANND